MSDQQTLGKKILYASLASGIGAIVGFMIETILAKQKQKNQKTETAVLKQQKEVGFQKKSLPDKQLPNQYRMIHRQSTQGQIKYNRLKIQNEDPNNCLLKELKFLDNYECDIARVHNLVFDLKLSEFPNIQNPLANPDEKDNLHQVLGGRGFLPMESFVATNSFLISNASFYAGARIDTPKRYLRAGPRRQIFFNPKEVKAAILASNEINPGINILIKELVYSLQFNYKVKEVYGVKYSFKGFLEDDYIKLDQEYVKMAHFSGGSILGIESGDLSVKNPDIVKIVDNIEKQKFNQIYFLGTLYDLTILVDIFREIKKRNLKVVVAGIPAIADGDFPIAEVTIGFDSVIQEAQRSISAAYVESQHSEYGVGIVRLPGKYCGYVSMHASQASLDVDICLVPEFSFELYGENGLLENVYKKVLTKRNCLIVISEGAGDAVIDDTVTNNVANAYGVNEYPDFGIFLKRKLETYFNERKLVANISYFDPHSQIQDVPANPYDRQLAGQAALNTVHGLMCGFTGFFTAFFTNKTCYVPLKDLLDSSSQTGLKPSSMNWQSLLLTTGQSSFINLKNKQQIIEDEENNESQDEN